MKNSHPFLSIARRLTRRGFLRLCGAGVATASAPSLAFGANAVASASGSARTDAPLPNSDRGAVSTTWAENWEDGMVSGNGRMGAVFYGKPESPKVLVNHSRLYTAQHDPAGIGPANTARFLPEIRRIIREEGYAQALDFTYQKSKENGLAPDGPYDFHPGFFLNLELAGASQPSDYRRRENFRTGEVETTWRGAAGSFRTRVFVSRADNVVVLSVEGPGKGQLDCDLSLDRIESPLMHSDAMSGADWIGVHNLYPPGNGGYDGVVRVVATGGSLKIEDGHARVSKADHVAVLMRIERYRPPQTGNIAAVAAALSSLQSDYAGLLAPHVKIHGGIFDRVRLDLGGGADRELSTDELLTRAASEKTLSPALMEKIYDACRYVILCSSGDLPPNLMGIWSGTWTPPWHGDYSIDANLQLEIDQNLSGNMPELMEGFFRLVEGGVPSWREGARKLAGCRGILYPARMQDQGTFFQQQHDWPWFDSIPLAGWLGHYFYDYYLHTGDRTFLEKRAIPFLKDCALFYEDWYVIDPDGRLRATPSLSEESAYCDNATYEFAIVREVLTNLIQSCQLLGVEAEGVARWKALLGRIPPYMINTPETTGGRPPLYKPMDGPMDSGVTPAVPDGTLKEFIVANMDEFPGHRHLSHLYPLFVSYEFDPVKTPELWKAAALTYERKIHAPHSSDSHYRLNASLCAARLGRGDDVWHFLTTMAVNGVFRLSLVSANGDKNDKADSARAYVVDANGGLPFVLHNCLVFSLPGQLDLLPALPKALPKGSIHGMVARGGILINRLAWDMEKGTVAVDLESSLAQEVAVSLPRVVVSSFSLNGRPGKVTRNSEGKTVARVLFRKGKSNLTVAFREG